MTSWVIGISAIVGLSTSYYVCGLVRRLALRHALVDLPNERSLHRVPVPRIGGVGIVVGCWLVTVLVLLGMVGHTATDAVIVLISAIAVAALGLFDDLRPLSAAARFPLQIAAASLIVLMLKLPARILLAQGLELHVPMWVQVALWPVFIVAVLNIYNFMDGMDGLAGTQALGAGFALAITFRSVGHDDLGLLAALLAAASGGFLLHNLPPAKIFMGDAGSTFLGFSFAALTLVGAARTPAVTIATPLLALSPFLLDGTFTIIRRGLRGEAVWRAHRSHLYQRAVGTGLTHKQVLQPYSVWILLATLAAIIAPSVGPNAVLTLALTMLACLALVWRWVTRRERLARAALAESR